MLRWAAMIFPSNRNGPGALGQVPLRLRILFFILLVIIPVYFIDSPLTRISESLRQAADENDLERASLKMAEVIGGADRKAILSGFLRGLAPRILKRMAGRTLPEALARGLQSDLGRKLPRTTVFLFFTPQGKLIRSGSSRRLEGTKVWEAFFAALRPDLRISETDRKLARNFALQHFGDLVGLSYFRHCLESPLEVLYDGRLNVLYHIPLADRKRGNLGSIMMLVPLYRAVHGWEVSRIISGLGDGETQFGGFWQSSGENLGAGNISGGLQHGLLNNLKEGNPHYRASDYFYLSRFWKTDSDLILTVGVPRQSSKWYAPEKIAGFLRLLLWFSAGGLGILVLLIPQRLPERDFSLAEKFRVGVILLTVVPLLVLGLKGFDQSLHMERAFRTEIERRLEERIGLFERNLGNMVSEEELKLVGITMKRGGEPLTSREDLQRIAEKYRLQKVQKFLLIQRNGDVLEETTLGKARSFSQNAVFFPIARDYLAREKFDVEKAEKNLGIPIEMRVSSTSASKIQGRHTFAMMDRFQKIKVGPRQEFFFVGFLLDAAGEKTGLLGVLYDFLAMAARSYEDVLRKAGPGCGLFLRATEGRSRTPSNRLVKGLVDAVWKTRKPLMLKIEHRGKGYIVLSRFLRGIEAVGTAVLPLEGSAPMFLNFYSFFGVLFGLAIGMAWVSAGLMHSYLLLPLLEMIQAIRRVREGDYRPIEGKAASDEFGAIAGSLDSLLEGLRQRVKMSSFLRPELIQQASTSPDAAVRRQRMGILFAGLREFRKVESGLTPEAAVEVMNTFHERCQAEINRGGGEVDKLIGDTVMAVFPAKEGRPLEQTVAETGVRLNRELDAWVLERRERGQPAPRFGIGLSIGTVLAGNIGSLARRLDFTVIGDYVNLAARLEKLAGSSDFPSLLISGDFPEGSEKSIGLVPTQIRSVRGRSGRIDVWTLDVRGPS